MWQPDSLFTGELYHHGIKGMKWGVRRTPEQLGHNTAKGKREAAKRELKRLSSEGTAAEKRARKEDRRISSYVTSSGKARRQAAHDAVGKKEKEIAAAEKAYSKANKDYKDAKKAAKEDYKELRRIANSWYGDYEDLDEDIAYNESQLTSYITKYGREKLDKMYRDRDAAAEAYDKAWDDAQVAKQYYKDVKKGRETAEGKAAVDKLLGRK